MAEVLVKQTFVPSFRFVFFSRLLRLLLLTVVFVFLLCVCLCVFVSRPFEHVCFSVITLNATEVRYNTDTVKHVF